VKIQLERGNWISGRVVDHSGRPVAGAQIGATNECAAEACTDSNGQFTAQGLGEGTVSLNVFVLGYLPFTGPKVKPNTADVDIRLEEEFSIEFQVVSSPLPDEYTLTIIESANRAPGLSIDIPVGARGTSALLKGVPAGEYEIKIESKGCQPVNVTRVLVPGGKKRITVPI
jgi:hypothetical protein